MRREGHVLGKLGGIEGGQDLCFYRDATVADLVQQWRLSGRMFQGIIVCVLAFLENVL